MGRRVQRRTGPPTARPVPTPPRQTPAQAKLLPCAVVFVGPMAVGKTSVGKRVAKTLGIPFIDTDARIAQAYGPITDFFASRGEAEFRRVEAEVVAQEVRQPGARVVSLGGGAVLDESTRALLAGFPVICLMSTERAVRKTANLSRRPLLKDDPGAWSRILDERRHHYDAVADVTFRTDRTTKEQVTRRVVAWIEDLPEQRHRLNCYEGAEDPTQTLTGTGESSQTLSTDLRDGNRSEADTHQERPKHKRRRRGRRGGRRRRNAARHNPPATS
jgi:shikimate kinase